MIDRADPAGPRVTQRPGVIRRHPGRRDVRDLRKPAIGDVGEQLVIGVQTLGSSRAVANVLNCVVDVDLAVGDVVDRAGVVLPAYPARSSNRRSSGCRSRERHQATCFRPHQRVARGRAGLGVAAPHDAIVGIPAAWLCAEIRNRWLGNVGQAGARSFCRPARSVAREMVDRRFRRRARRRAEIGRRAAESRGTG